MQQTAQPQLDATTTRIRDAVARFALLSLLLAAATAQAQPAPQQLFPASPGAGDRFGTAVVVSGSGDTALVGAYFDDTTAGQNAGSRHIFNRNFYRNPSTGSWAL